VQGLQAMHLLSDCIANCFFPAAIKGCTCFCNRNGRIMLLCNQPGKFLKPSLLLLHLLPLKCMQLIHHPTNLLSGLRSS